jgi:putative ABC transport system permease protein
MVGALSQIVAVTLLGVRTLPRRLASSSVAVVGIAAVAAVFVALLSMAEGFRLTMARTGAPDAVVVLRAGSDAEMTSVFMRDQANMIADAAGLARGPHGAIASAELFVTVDLPKRSTGSVANVPLRGVEPAAFQVRPNVRMVAGRRFQTGSNEIIVGRGAASQFANTEIGTMLKVGANQWKVVGIFDSGGTAADSELWCDALVLGPAYNRGNSFQSIYAKLESPDAFDRFKDALTTDPRLNVKVMREQDYYAQQSTLVYTMIRVLGLFIGGLMGIGAIFAAINTMYSAVASRSREIAMLRALGFRSGPVVVSVLSESVLLAVVGGVLGGLIAFFGFNGYQTATINWQSFSQVAFAFAVTPALLVRGVVYAILIGLVGGLFPAIRAARVPVVIALREL